MILVESLSFTVYSKLFLTKLILRIKKLPDTSIKKQND